jgi:hypothetical protein
MPVLDLKEILFHLVQDPVFSGDTAKLLPRDLARAHSTLKALEKRLKSRLEQLHGPLLEQARDSGTAVGETGTMQLEVGPYTVCNQRRQNKEPEYQKMVDLLDSKGIELEKVYDKVVTFTFNPSKANALVDTGHLQRSEVDSLRKVTHALLVEVDPDASKEMESVLGGKK